MATEPARFRPKIYPAPEFPPRRPARFARVPPAVFPVILGALGLALALRRGMAALDLPQAPADIVAGAALALWVFAAAVYAVKLGRRPSVLWDELKVLPGRAGLASGSAGGLVVAALLVPYAPELARVVLFAGLGLHGLVALATARALAMLPAEGRGVDPGWHLTFVGFIIAGLAAVPLGHVALAQVVFWATLPVAGLIWVASVMQLVSHVPPAPLRPMLAIHLVPAALFSTVAGLIGLPVLALGFAVVGLAVAAALVVAARWIVASGFSALWGAFTFPLTALAATLLAQGGGLPGGGLMWAGVVALVAALGVVPAVLWRVMKAWPGGQLAARTNAAEA